MSKQQQLLAMLADGQLHSGNELADALGITRAAIWKHIHQLEDLGIGVVAQAGQGYRLESSLELFDQQHILTHVPDSSRAALSEFQLLWQTESTSDFLLRNGATEAGSARVCLAEYQSGGRGRRGRQWFAPAGHSICLSIGWCFPQVPASLSCLGLAVGVAVLRAVRAVGAADAMLKWPNDVVLQGQKLAGILIDVQGEASGPLQVVVGVGLNYRLNAAVEQVVVDAGGVVPASLAGTGLTEHGRNTTTGLLIAELIDVLQQFERKGFADLADEWRSADYLAGKNITVHTDGGAINGVASGISTDGQLRVKVGDQVQTMMTGDVSVRLAE